MTSKTYFIGAVVAGAGLLASGVPAMADTGDDDGVNVGNDNNVQLLPVQLCDVNVVGKLVQQDSPEKVKCGNAPLVDHPKVEHPAESHPAPARQAPPQHQAPPHHAPPQHHAPSKPHGLPMAPSGTPHAGHYAVTG